MPVVTIRVPDRLKRKMRKVKSVNWSALLRDAIQARIELERRPTAKEWERVREAGVRAGTIYKEMASKYGYIDLTATRHARSRSGTSLKFYTVAAS